MRGAVWLGGASPTGLSLRRFLPRRVTWEPYGVALSAVLLYLNSARYLGLLLLAATLHEGGHLLCAGVLSCPLGCLRLGLLGARLELADALEDYRKEEAVALAGSFVNFSACVLSFFFVRGGGGEGAVFFFFANLLLGLINLLPADGLDGGLAVYARLARRRDALFAYRFLQISTPLCLIPVTLLSLWLTYHTGKNLSVLVLCLGLLFRFYRGKKEKRPR